MRLAITVKHTRESQKQIYDMLDELKEGYKNRILRVAAERAARKTVPDVKTSMMNHRSSGATYKAITSKVVRIRGKSIYVGIVGAGADPGKTKGKFTVIHPLFGYRKPGDWRQTNPGTNRPQEIGHLIEGGRKPVSGKGKHGVLAFVVAKLDGRRARPGKFQKFTGRLSNQYRVKNGYLIFAKRAAGVAGSAPIKSNEPNLAANLITALQEASVNELRRLAARAAARGSSLYRS